MDIKLKYRTDLDKLKNLPDYNRIRTEQRFLLIREYRDHFLKEEAKALGSDFRIKVATEKFCRLNCLSLRTFYRWLRIYSGKGIKALIPAYGNRQRKSIFADHVLSVIFKVVVPGKGYKSALDKYIAICKKENLQVPSYDAFRRVLIAHKLSGIVIKRNAPNKEAGSLKRTITASLEINVNKPLSCLHQLKGIIQGSPFIAPAKKEASLKLLSHMLPILKRKSSMYLDSPLTDEEKEKLRLYKRGLHKKHSVKATVILMVNDNCTMLDIVTVTNRPTRTIYRWLRELKKKRVGFVETKVSAPAREKAHEERKNKIIDILHQQPSLYNINRTSWTYGTIAQAYKSRHGEEISETIIQHVIKKAGYTWKHARKVLTSHDPCYNEKVDRVIETLQNLKENEAFFFVDEAGPYRVKKYGGRALTALGETRIIPQYQKSKGNVQFIAALEAVANQVTWLFIESKDSSSVIALLETICQKYAHYTKLYLTWDSISTHSAHDLSLRIEQLNKKTAMNGSGPIIEVVPLPSKSQFLNVIEAVISGMKRAVIHNSDYASKREMEEAISRRFEERNSYYISNPKRAGNKIWDKEAFDIEKLRGGLFKKM